MDDFALILNAGSSSLKFCVFRRPAGDKWLLESRGQIEGIGTSARIQAKNSNGVTIANTDLSSSVSDGSTAIRVLAAWLRAQYGGAKLLAVGHRVVHGGTRYSHPVLITREILSDLYQLVPLAPLHQPHNLAAIEAVLERMPEVPQVACFDTSFHVGRSPVSEIVPLPSEFRKLGMQRYGFHGLSYQYVASALKEIAPKIAMGRVIVAHLGSGSSMCALKNGKSVDTSMGFTALDGLCMGTRAGSLDPGIILYLVQALKMSASEIESLLYKKSGLLGISGFSNDMRELLASSVPEARIAIDYFVYRAAKEIGALTATLGGLDALVFTAGIGENSSEIRKRISEASAWLGIEIDDALNRPGNTKISSPESKVPVLVIPTNEELLIARQTGVLLRIVEPALSA